MNADRSSHDTRSFRDRLALAVLRAAAALPLRVNRMLGLCIGWLLWWLPNENRRVTRINVDLCLPHLSPEQRRQLARRSVVETGKGITELGWVWNDPDAALALTEDCHEQISSTLQDGRSVVILAPHLGCWEVLNFWLASRFNLHAMFMPGRLPGVDALVRRSREQLGSSLYPATPEGVRGLMRNLKRSATITAILPDQVAARRAGKFAPFFDRPAWTGTLACRLIQSSGARAFMAYARRLPGSEGYQVVLRDPDPAIYDEELDRSLAALNRSIERLVMEAPEQFLWSYKRFRRAPEGKRSPYK